MVWVYIAVALVCTQVPLFDVLGYESAMVFGVVSAPVVLCTIELPYKDEDTVPWWIREVHKQIYPLLSPIGIFAVNSLFIQNCDWWGGLLFWFVIPIQTVVIVVGLVGLVAQLFGSRIRILVLFILILDVLFLLWRLAWWPPISGFNIIIGWFAGSIYDEALTLPVELILYRLYSVLIVFILSLSCQVVRAGMRRPKILEFSWVCCILALTFSIFSEPLVFRDAEWVKSELGASLETDHFIVYFNPRDISAFEEHSLQQDLEFRYSELKEYFKEDPVVWKGRKIEVFIYPNATEQHRLMGSRNTFVARPWTHQMHLRWSFGSNALAHELSHLFSAPFGGWFMTLPTYDNGLINIGLLEGVAVAADWPESQFSPHIVSAVLLEDGLLPDIAEAFNPMGFWKNASGRAYQSVGSFVKWLIDEYGIDKMKRFYQGTEFYDVYGVELDESIIGWVSYLELLNVDNIHKKQILMRYDKPSIFQKVCARRIAEQVRMIDKFEDERRYVEAIEAIDKLLQWREYPYYNCKKLKIVLENNSLKNNYDLIQPPENMLTSTAVHWMDLYLTFAVTTEQSDNALIVLSDLESWPVSSAWKRRFLVQKQMLLEQVEQDYFRSTWNTFDRIQWLEVHYPNGVLYEYLLAVNQSALGQFDLLLERKLSPNWPDHLQSNFIQLQFLAALQLEDLQRSTELLDQLKYSPQIDEFHKRTEFLKDYLGGL